MKPFLKNLLNQIVHSCGFNTIQLATIERMINRQKESDELEDKIRECLYKGKSRVILDIRKFNENLYLVNIEDTFATWRTVDVGRMVSNSQCSNDYETQVLITLSLIYEGANGRFAEYACNMLGKKLD